MSEVNLSFDEIRPYFDSEVPGVIQQLSQKPSFFALMNYLFPTQSKEEIVERFSKITGVEQFQTEIIQHAIWRMVEESADEITHEGLDQLEEGKCYLFLSNHRDIILDSAILNVLLKKRGRPTTKIAIGDNLLVSSLVTDLMKLNKSFIVHRDVARQDMVPFSKRLSSYIREQITSGSDSIWIAHRNGRAKDGNDVTNTGLLKMLNFSANSDLAEGYKALNIIPMAISYEFDPCDGLKAEELYHTNRGLPYTKDDKVGMVNGIRGEKGRVHLKLGNHISTWIDKVTPIPNFNMWLRSLANALDCEIHKDYKLWPSNYVALDALNGDSRHSDHYNEEEKAKFFSHMEQALVERIGEQEGLKKHFLEIYANPVLNQQNCC